MATTQSGIGTPPVTSPRSKARDSRSTVPCRNLTQYGYCRHENCLYNHSARNNNLRPESAGQRLFNVNSPSFTPSSVNGSTTTPSIAKKAFSPKSANATAFVPRSSKSAFPQSPPSHRPQSQSQTSPHWRNRDIPEFVPQSFTPQQATDNHATSTLAEAFNPYAEQSSFNGLDNTPPSQQINPYVGDTAGSNALTYYQQHDHLPPLQHHLYANVGPRREDLKQHERTAHDFFISEELRQELQRKADATLQVLPNSSLPATVDDFHSLVPLDMNAHKTNQGQDWKTWVYKATRTSDGATYALRRIEGYRVSRESTVLPLRAWERVENASIVNVRGCFTTRDFGDTSLVVFTDYHPTSKNLAEHHFPYVGSQRGRPSGVFVPEQILWSYIVQLASALKTIHTHGLAARNISPNKVILTGKNRVRLSGLGIADLLHPEEGKSLAQLQQEDLQQLGQLVLALTSKNAHPPTGSKMPESMSRAYHPRLKECVSDLIDKPSTIDAFLATIADQMVGMLNGVLHAEDDLTTNMMRELENGRLVRLVTKLGFINERQEYNSHSPEGQQWSETGERYYLKLFRDYVFHQVSSDGRPVLDLGHVISCLNKLDAGSEERIALVTRDEQHVLIVSYKEIKRGLETAFQDLAKVQRRSG